MNRITLWRAALVGALAVQGGVALAAGGRFSDQEVQRGAYLARAGDCVACHSSPGGKPFVGGLKMVMPVGAIYSSNITPDKTHGIGNYSFEQFDRAVRHGVAPGGKYLYPAMPYPSYARITPQDMKALYAYFMQGVPPDPTPNRKPDMVWPMTIRWPLAIWNWLFVRDTTFTPNPKQSAQWNRGAYLVEGLGHCGACHTPRGLFFQEKALSANGPNGKLYLTGGTVEHWYASNLRSACLQKTLSAEDFALLLKTGSVNNFTVAGGMTEVIHHSTQHLSHDDLLAIGTYIKSMPSEISAQVASTKPDPAAVQRGKALYDQHCAACHQPTGQGVPAAFPSLAGNPSVRCIDPTNAIHVILAGGTTAVTASAPAPMAMPPFGSQLSDQQVADLVTYIRTSWGNAAEPVSAAQVKELRRAIDKR
ncbi:MAG: alcohol dehydrogenase [Thiomonas sp. 20-64-9]|nr:MAG: alcohol dehydrogenase [Thiomonas sp. 20-64-9]